MRRTVAALLLLCAAAAARAAPAAVEPCELPPRYGLTELAVRIVRTACQEHRLWLQPFIEADGRLAALAVTEAERAHLDDGSTQAWQRVARYWRESGTLAAMADTPGASACMAPYGQAAENDCRAFVVDQPWSAAFVSWVMLRAGVPGFAASPRHLDYVAHAWRDPASPYLYADPWTTRPAPGDLLCFLRGADAGRGADGLRQALAGQTLGAVRSHCEIVVAANPGGDRTLYLVGGNVLNAVTLRKLPLDPAGRLDAAALGRTGTPPPAGEDVPPSAGMEDAGAGPACSPGNPAACSFNRRDWAVLLQLRLDL